MEIAAEGGLGRRTTTYINDVAVCPCRRQSSLKTKEKQNLFCSLCNSRRVYKDGLRYTQKGRVQAYQCRSCGKKTQASGPLTPERVGYLDIEASGLKSDFGHIISWAIKAKGGKVLFDVLKERTLKEEKRILQTLLETMKSFDRLITYYGSRFDVPFIRTRALYHGLQAPQCGELLHTDLYFVAKHKLSTLASKRLERVSKFLGIKDKTPLEPEVWVAASFGDKQAISYILQHNIADVKVLEQVDERLEQYYKKVNTSL